MNASHPTWIEIDRSAVTQNCRQIIQDTGTALMERGLDPCFQGMKCMKQKI